MKSILGWTFLVLALLGLGPLLTLWSLNTLFPQLAIPYNLETWAAAGILFGGIFSLRSK